jgi:hypothetical protein
MWHQRFNGLQKCQTTFWTEAAVKKNHIDLTTFAEINQIVTEIGFDLFSDRENGAIELLAFFVGNHQNRIFLHSTNSPLFFRNSAANDGDGEATPSPRGVNPLAQRRTAALLRFKAKLPIFIGRTSKSRATLFLLSVPFFATGHKGSFERNYRHDIGDQRFEATNLEAKHIMGKYLSLQGTA